MSESRFESIWLPRLGERATAELRRSAYTAMVMGPAVLVISAMSGLAFGWRGLVGDGIGIAGLVVAATFFMAWVQSRRRFAAAVSDWFGEEIPSGEMPRMTPTLWDAWAAGRGLRHPDSVPPFRPPDV